jgi:hypothetical protein
VSLFDSAEDLEIGRRLVESGADPESQVDQLRMVSFYERQREIVRRYGCCGHGEVWISPMGVACCAHTRDPCPRQALRALLELASLINRGEHGKRSSKKARRGYRRPG